MELQSVPGVGPKTADSLRELDDPVEALMEGDVAAIASAADLPTGRAVTLVQNAQRAVHGDTSEFLATARARELYRDLIDDLQQYAQTGTGRARLATFYPSASRERVDEARAVVEAALETEVDDAAIAALSDVGTLEPARRVRIRERCLATADAETLGRANDVLPELPVESVETARDIVELSHGYSSVIVLDAEFAGKDLPTDVQVDPDALERPVELVPERSLAFIGQNRTAIEAAIEVHRHAGLTPPCPLEELAACLEGVTSSGELTGDDELRRLQQACDDLDVAISTAESVANDRLRDAIERRDITVEGADLLTLAEQGAPV